MLQAISSLIVSWFSVPLMIPVTNYKLFRNLRG